jgi:hypothetical protein
MKNALGIPRPTVRTRRTDHYPGCVPAHDEAMPIRPSKRVTIQPAVEHDEAMPITPVLLQLGPVRVEASTKLDLTVEAPSVARARPLYRVEVREAEWLMACTSFGAWLGHYFGPTGSVIGGVSALIWGAWWWPGDEG